MGEPIETRRQRLQDRIDGVLRRLSSTPGGAHYSPYVHYPGEDPSHIIREAAKKGGVEAAVDAAERLASTHHPAQVRHVFASFLAGDADARQMNLRNFVDPEP